MKFSYYLKIIFKKTEAGTESIYSLKAKKSDTVSDSLLSKDYLILSKLLDAVYITIVFMTLFNYFKSKIYPKSIQYINTNIIILTIKNIFNGDPFLLYKTIRN